MDNNNPLLKDENQLYDIIFDVNRHTYQLQHHALECLVAVKLFDSMIKNPIYNTTLIKLLFECFNDELDRSKDYIFRCVR